MARFIPLMALAMLVCLSALRGKWESTQHHELHLGATETGASSSPKKLAPSNDTMLQGETCISHQGEIRRLSNELKFRAGVIESTEHAYQADISNLRTEVELLRRRLAKAEVQSARGERLLQDASEALVAMAKTAHPGGSVGSWLQCQREIRYEMARGHTRNSEDTFRGQVQRYLREAITLFRLGKLEESYSAFETAAQMQPSYVQIDAFVRRVGEDTVVQMMSSENRKIQDMGERLLALARPGNHY